MNFPTEIVRNIVRAMFGTGSTDVAAGDHTHGAGPGAVDWGDIGGTLSDQTDLQGELDGKSDVGHDHDLVYSMLGHDHDADYEPFGAVATHAGLANPHPVYLTQAEGDALYSVLAHDHAGVYAPVLGADDNYVTDAEKVKLSNLSGTNTGDQTLPVKATGAETDTGTDDAKFLTPKAIEDSAYVKAAAVTTQITGTKIDDLTAGDDNTDLDASTAKHGLMQKYPGGTANFLRADGTFAAPTASVNIKQTEVDFGTTPIDSASFIIVDADVSGTSSIIASIAYEAPTDKDLDELEMDMLSVIAAPGSGQLTLFIQSADGSYLADKFKINYLIG